MDNSVSQMAFKFGSKAEGIDQYGVWYKCKVIDVTEEEFVVSFPGWKGWDRSLKLSEIRSERELSRKRKLPLGHEVGKVTYFSLRSAMIFKISRFLVVFLLLNIKDQDLITFLFSRILTHRGVSHTMQIS